MIGYRKVFLDTTPIIYFLDEDVNYADKVKSIFEEILKNEKLMISSVVTCAEYLVYPYKTNNQEKIDAFFEFISDCDIPLYPVDLKIARKAAKIRAGMNYISRMFLSLVIYTWIMYSTNLKENQFFLHVPIKIIKYLYAHVLR